MTAALALAFASAASDVSAATRGAQTQQGGIQLRNELHALMPAGPKAPQSPATTLTVTSCLDDNGGGTLRAMVAAAGEGDTVDLSTLQCSSITLNQGAIPVLLNSLALSGPGSSKLTIDGGGVGRVLVHPGYGVLQVTGLTVSGGAVRVGDNHITGGGCIASAGYVVLDHSTVSHCYGSGVGVYGGGVFAYGLYMYTSVLSASTAHAAQPSSSTAAFGGGAYAAYMVVFDSTISGNRAEHAGDVFSKYDTGGGLFSNFAGFIQRSTIEGNYSGLIGGGLSTFGGKLTIIDSTISGNQAKAGSGGGLNLRVFYGGSINNSTIAGNSAAGGGGVYLRGRPDGFVLQSTIISGNGVADIGADGTAGISGANNLVMRAGASVTLPPGTLREDPMLLALDDNGGPTRTHALMPGSPALDAGNNALNLASDQRGAGFARVLGGAADIGAFEGFVQRPFVRAPTLSQSLMGALAVLLGAIGAIVARKHRPKQFFTPLSPDREHSSHR